MKNILINIIFLLLLSVNKIESEVVINAGILIGTGFDDITFSIAFNLLNRAGIKVDVIKVSKKYERKLNDIRVMSESEVSVKADYHFASIEKKKKQYDLLIIPHGDQHCEMLGNNEDVIKMLKSQIEQKKQTIS